MQRWILCALALGAGLLVNAGMELRSAGNLRAAGRPPRPKTVATNVLTQPNLDDLVSGKLEVVDLAWPLNAASAFWPGDNYKPFELHTIATLETDGVLSKAFASPEHLGTHIDAPSHFEPNQPSVDQLTSRELFAPGVVVDVSPQASTDADYLLTVDDLREFEDTYGPIPKGAVVLAYTGWSKFWNNPTRYANKDVMSRLHFPGFSSEAVEFLIGERQVRGVGLDTMSVDHGLSRDFRVHHLLGKASRFGLENLAQLDKLPASGFFVLVAPMKIETGSGGPTRVFAVFAKTGGEN